MFQHFYKLFIAPRQLDEDTRNRELVLNILLFSTLVIFVLYLGLLLQSYYVLRHDFVVARVWSTLGGLVFLGSLYWLARTGRYRVAAFLLVSLYFLAAGSVVFQWGTTITTGVLLFGLVIVLAGILLGSNYSLYAAGGVAVLLIGLQMAAEHGVLHPDWSWATMPPSLGDVLSFCIMFGILGVVSWLFNHQMERSLRRAKRAEIALTKQKEALEDTVAERTRQLQAEQLEKVQQMYRFAELGQLSTALMHELANHLTTLTLDIEGLKNERQSAVLQRAKRSIRYIEDMVHRVRDQLHGKTQPHLFNVVNEISNVVSILQHKAIQAHVTLMWEAPVNKKDMRCRGEPIRFRQLIANLLSNAIEAYNDPGSDGSEAPRKVVVTAAVRGKTLTITVNDWGRGMTAQDRAKLFEPFYSTKKTGMGMGLFIARQIAEEHMGGTLRIDTAEKHTAFVMTFKRAGS